MTIHYRPATSKEHGIILAIAQALHVFQPSLEHKTWAAVYDGHLVGFISWLVVWDTADLLAIAILPAFQRQGIAQRLHQHSCPKALCTLEVRESNLAAKALYQKLGYQYLTTRPDYYPPLPPQTSRESALIYQYDNR